MIGNFVRDKRGITYLEVVVAMAILSIVLMFMVNMITISSKLQFNNEETTRMVLQAQSAMENIKTVPNNGTLVYPYLNIVVVNQTSQNSGVDPYDLVSYNLGHLQ